MCRASAYLGADCNLCVLIEPLVRLVSFPSTERYPTGGRGENFEIDQREEPLQPGMAFLDVGCGVCRVYVDLSLRSHLGDCRNRMEPRQLGC